MIFSSPEYPVTALKLLNEMRQNNEFCDILISINGTKYAAHKAILVAGSQYMRQHLANLTTKVFVLNLQLTSLSVFEEVLQFLYNGQIELTEQNIAEMTMLASYLQMPELLNLTSQFINSFQEFSVANELAELEYSIEPQDVSNDQMSFLDQDDSTENELTSSPAKKQKTSTCNEEDNSTIKLYERRWKKFQCKTCGKQFSRKYICINHCLSHVDKSSGSFLCNHCGNLHKTVDELRTHYSQSRECWLAGLNRSQQNSTLFPYLSKRDILNGLRFKCDVCFEKYENFVPFQTHRRNEHGIEETLKCSICNECFDTEEFLTCHIPEHYKVTKNYERQQRSTKRPTYQPKDTDPSCPICRKLFSCKKTLKRHLETNRRGHCGKLLQKINSSEETSSPTEEEQNESSDNITGYLCDGCKVGFEKFAEFASHCLELHGTNPEMKCRFCELVFAKELWVDKHVEYHVTQKQEETAKGEEYTCQLCAATFQSDNNFQCHKTMKCASECRFCGKRFSRFANLRRHVRTHTGDRPYPCFECDLSFARKDILFQHLRLRHSIVMPRQSMIETM
uniref:Kelch-like protein 2 n=1 Tax=Phallusia mammillata TaxID=59560 RepID=A0A6F9DGM8_9ASCI|nr:kelch-like protein 2 [Phallusia mammillata]